MSTRRNRAPHKARGIDNCVRCRDRHWHLATGNCNDGRLRRLTVADPAGDMVLVPEGDFRFGASAESRSLPAFYIDRTEVTGTAYAAYRAAQLRVRSRVASQNPIANVTIQQARDFCDWAGKRLPTAMEWEKAARARTAASILGGTRRTTISRTSYPIPPSE
jgi:formylglycine-generating enzyme required for sulfatase activity